MTTVRQIRGAKARRSGRRAEVLAAAWLMLKGYRILGFRLPTPLGEIDLLAQRGDLLVVVEVKQRASLDDALDAVTFDQRARLRRAAAHLVQNRAGLRNASIRLDLIALAPGRWPRHLRDAWMEAQ
jgi:putative endonuclease